MNGKEYLAAAQAKDFNELSALIDANNPDFSEDQYKLKLQDFEEMKYVISKTGINNNTFGGSVPDKYNGYNLLAQTTKLKKGTISINPDGSYTFTITDPGLLNIIKGENTVNISEELKIAYTKLVPVSSIPHLLLAYASAYSTAEVVQKLLDHGCCPNSNIEAYLNYSAKVGSLMKYAPPKNSQTLEENILKKKESKALINAVRAGKNDVCSVLVNHSCPCCNDSGAVISDLVVAEAEQVSSEMKQHIESLQV